jgi:hypothetical protein
MFFLKVEERGVKRLLAAAMCKDLLQGEQEITS